MTQRAKRFAPACVLTVCALSALPSPTTAQSLTMRDVMTAAERAATGVDELTHTQRAALDKWLADYTVKVLSATKSMLGVPSATSRGEYAGLGSRHWIKTVSSGGKLVELEDGSLWEVNAIDRIYTGIWLPISNITVILAETSVGDYRYTLINRDDGEMALVKYLGR